MAHITVPSLFTASDRFNRHCKLPVHSGLANFGQHGNPNDPFRKLFAPAIQQERDSRGESSAHTLNARFAVPATGGCVILLTSENDTGLSRDFGSDLTVDGDGPDGVFKLVCPEYYVSARSTRGEERCWAVARPVNKPAIIHYGVPRRIASVSAMINNFDFEHGNQPNGSSAGGIQVLRVEAKNRTVDFRWRKERVLLRNIVDSGLIPTTSFVEFTFLAENETSDDELIQFCRDTSTFLSYVNEQHTGVSVVTLCDEAGLPVRRHLFDAIESEFRSGCAFRVIHADNGLPRFFRECFNEHMLTQRHREWREFVSYCAGVEDSTYLEQKYASLMAALEKFIRISLTENGAITNERAITLTLPKLIEYAKSRLRWDIPLHYTEHDRYRDNRNKVAHGNSLTDDISLFRDDFDKWRLFLRRHVFLRLGYRGRISSPQRGFLSSSPVDEFSEEHNSFRR